MHNLSSWHMVWRTHWGGSVAVPGVQILNDAPLGVQPFFLAVLRPQGSTPDVLGTWTGRGVAKTEAQSVPESTHANTVQVSTEPFGPYLHGALCPATP